MPFQIKWASPGTTLQKTDSERCDVKWKDTEEWSTVAGGNPSAWESPASHRNIRDEICKKKQRQK